VNVKDVSFKSLRGQVGIVTQEAILFNDSVKNNIAYGTFDVTMDQIQQAAQMAFADKFIEKMPKGYDTFVGDRGFRLSGGEKQRLTIARAILKNPPILILDEATSQLRFRIRKICAGSVRQADAGAYGHCHCPSFVYNHEGR
jgi:subfamily B ATP-binding cassette protein MsbA